MNHFANVPHLLFPRSLFICVIAMLCLGGSQQVSAATPKEERDECARNLQAIYEAVQSYRNEHQTIPDWLSNLIPDHLPGPNRLICPVTRRTGEVINYGLSDPKVSTSYVYEFCNQPIPESIQGGAVLTMQEWKQLQMALAGSIVPMIRCHHHSPILNLSFDGKIYESPESWETEISGIVKPEHLTPGYLFNKFGRVGANRFTAVDLSEFYNCSLTESLHSLSGREPGPSLALVPDGEQSFGGITFDVRGLVHLQGRELKKMAPDRYPDRVQNIPIGLKTSRLHFLVGAGWPSADTTEIARFIIRYSDGKNAIIPVQYNRQVTDWMHAIVGGENAPRPAWSGDINPSPNETQIVNLYRISWDNPRPDVLIESLDIESTLQDTAMFVVGISARRE